MLEILKVVVAVVLLWCMFDLHINPLVDATLAQYTTIMTTLAIFMLEYGDYIAGTFTLVAS